MTTTRRAARALLLLLCATLLASCSFLADEFSVIDRAAPSLLSGPPPATLEQGQ